MKKRDAASSSPEDPKAWPGEPRGILVHEWKEEHVSLERFDPGRELAPFVDYLWSAQWDLRGCSPIQEESLPHPCVHLVIERGRSGVFGVMRGRFTRVLEGLGSAFGVKFQPGGFHSLLGAPVCGITDRVIPIGNVLGPSGSRLEREVLAADGLACRVQIASAFLISELGSPCVELRQVRAIVDYIAGNVSVTRVEDLVARFGMSIRRMQRLFGRLVGVGPKWVIQRSRLHETVARIHSGEDVDWVSLALELGYADQAHLIRDFKTVVGTPPASFARHSLFTRPQ